MLTAEAEARGMKAYEQARAFENLRAWKLPVSYAVLVVVPVVFGGALFQMEHVKLATVSGILAVSFAGACWFHWQKLKRLYAWNLALLTDMKKAYGDQLPWVQMENHFAKLERLKQELFREREASADGDIYRRG